MKQIASDLWQSEPYHPFPYLKTQCYLLMTSTGNILFYNTGLDDEFSEIEKKGGYTTHCLSHRHESSEKITKLKQRFKAKLVCEKTEAEAFALQCTTDIFITERTTLESGVIAIPTPGHTSGGCCYFYQSPHNERYLFTGDLFYVTNNNLSTFVYSPDGGSQQALIDSLGTLYDYEPSWVLSSAFEGDSSSLPMEPSIWRQEIERNIATLKS